jgi:hypothetical protein
MDVGEESGVGVGGVGVGIGVGIGVCVVAKIGATWVTDPMCFANREGENPGEKDGTKAGAGKGAGKGAGMGVVGGVVFGKCENHKAMPRARKTTPTMTQAVVAFHFVGRISASPTTTSNPPTTHVATAQAFFTELVGTGTAT